MRLAKRLAQRKIGNELFIVDTRNQMLHVPNSVGEFIWELLKKGKSQGEILQKTLDQFEVEKTVAEKDINEFMTELRQKKILED